MRSILCDQFAKIATNVRGASRIPDLVVCAFLSLVPLLTESVVFGQRVPVRASLESFQATHRKLYEEFLAKTNELAKRVEAQGQHEVVEQIRSRQMPPTMEIVRSFSLPEDKQTEIRLEKVPAERQWQATLRSLEQQYAKDLFLLSRRVLSAGYPGYAWILVQETAQHDSDHAAARKLLGYVPSGKKWLTPFAAEMERKHMVWHDRFGWLPENFLVRYEEGQRYVDGSWVSVEREAEIRANFHKAWEVRTDHFRIRTNSSLEQGVESREISKSFISFFINCLRLSLPHPSKCRSCSRVVLWQNQKRIPLI